MTMMAFFDIILKQNFFISINTKFICMDYISIRLKPKETLCQSIIIVFIKNIVWNFSHDLETLRNGPRL